MRFEKYDEFAAMAAAKKPIDMTPRLSLRYHGRWLVTLIGPAGVVVMRNVTGFRPVVEDGCVVFEDGDVWHGSFTIERMDKPQSKAEGGEA